jgi:hypothetical protein
MNIKQCHFVTFQPRFPLKEGLQQHYPILYLSRNSPFLVAFSQQVLALFGANSGIQAHQNTGKPLTIHFSAPNAIGEARVGHVSVTLSA